MTNCEMKNFFHPKSKNNTKRLKISKKTKGKGSTRNSSLEFEGVLNIFVFTFSTLILNIYFSSV